jgi:hypothetical protein
VQTNEKDYKIFQAEFRRWVELLGLGDWALEFEWKHTEGTEALVEATLCQRLATVVLAKEVQDGRDVKELAKHEAMELLLMPLRVLAMERFSTCPQIDEAVHAVIQRLSRVLGGEKRCGRKSG